MILFSHPLSTAFTREAALALAEAGLLEEVLTSVHWTPGCRAEKFLPGTVVKELRRRSYPEAVRGRVRTHPWREAARLAAMKLPGMGWLTRHETGLASVDAVFHDLDRAAARRVRAGGLHGVYAYEDGALATFQAADEAGLKKIYDLPIGYWRVGQRIFAEEAELVPEWAATLTGRGDSAEKLARKDAEIAAADAVVVASSFTRQTLAEAPGATAPVFVTPYGAPAVNVEASRPAVRRGNEPLRVIFAGMLGQRKGLAYLLQAVERLGKHVELTLLGVPTTKDCPALDAAIRKHRYLGSQPHSEVLREMACQDVLVFPSLFEGFGLVLLEAMSQGVTVITTPHTAGPDILDDGVDGFIVPIRSAEAIVEKLELLRGDRARCAAMGEAARRKAAACSWQVYRERVVNAARLTLGVNSN